VSQIIQLNDIIYEEFSMKKYFDKYSKWEAWSRQQKFTIHRQEQLAYILKQYGGEIIPFSHFTREIDMDPAKRNKYAFPVIFACICGILKIEGDHLKKPEGLVLGERIISKNETHWL
jgi:hypothetical protein